MLHITVEDLGQCNTGFLAIPVCEDADLSRNPVVVKLIGRAMSYPEFKGGAGDELMLYDPEGVSASRVLFIGVGKKEKADPESFRTAAGKAVKRAIQSRQMDIVFCGCGKKAFVHAIMEGALLGNHRFDFYKQDRKKKPLSTITVHVEPSRQDAFEQAVPGIEAVCRGTIMARDWVSAPPNDKRPDMFARSIVKAADMENLTIVDIDERNIRKNKLHALLAVGAGSDTRPRMVVIDYRPDKYDKTIALVGKGVTFDSGGLNLKTGSGITDMKQDMAGAAAVAATLITAARMAIGHRIIGILPLVENMPSGNAYRPGDIIRTASGKTVEIANTDAEGRMILADAIFYAVKQYNPDTLIDVATLTGACKMALGNKFAGVFSFDARLAARLVSSGEKTHERCWAMPMPEDYRDMLKSDIADIRNVGKSRWGGAIAAALFLSEFVQDVNWAHIDIAGPAFSDKANAYCPSGGTGFGVRLLIDWLGGL
ncbi:MAG: leucyl aminopeptidase [Desulfosalsimonadaceae bacterium]